MVCGHRVSDAYRPDVHRNAPGVHLALGRAWRVDASRCDQPPTARRRYGDHGAGPVLCAGRPEHALGADISAGMRGEPLLVEGSVSRVDGTPLAGAIVDTWHADGDGFYDVQAATGLEGLAGRSRFRTDEQGRFWFRSIVPACYPIPNDGPVGDMLKLQGRHLYRPAHVHFMVSHPGCETLVTHIFLAGDKYLDSDVVFGVKDSLIRALEEQRAGKTARDNFVDHPVKALRYDFVLAEPRPAQSGEVS